MVSGVVSTTKRSKTQLNKTRGDLDTLLRNE